MKKIAFPFIALLTVFMNSKSLILGLTALVFIFSFSNCKKENQLPSCSITYPNNGDEFEQGDTITISVEADDQDGLIAEVNFYINDIGIFSSNSFPYTFTWNTSGETIGDHIIKVIAKDNEGGSKTDECTISIIGNATIVTIEASSITHNTAMSGGNITNDGGTSILERGVCWNNSQNPTLLNEHTTDGSGSGSFTSTITGLTQNTTYYVRAYATNSVGTAYGSEETFTTPTTPTLTTTAISAITDNSAQSGGNITDDGGATVTARGVCWSTSWSPTIADSKTTDGSGTGSFTSSLTGLSSETTYYVRAYATNSVGSEYGQQVILKTYNTVTDFDRNVYYTVIIGTQTWMAKNLKATHYADGTAILLVEDNSAWNSLGDTNKAYCYYNNNSSNCDTYGALYTWAAAMNGAISSDANPSSIQGICPDGWHLPSDAEWRQLIDYLGGESAAGGKLKETGNTHWNNPNDGATNESGFTALPGGYRISGTFGNIWDYGYWWSSTEGYFGTPTPPPWYITMYYNNSSAFMNFAYAKKSGLSVRCVKNE